MLSALKHKLLGPKMPDAAWLWDAHNETQYTPDIARLESYELQLVFVVDDLQKSFKNHSIIKEGIRASLGSPYTRDLFSCWKKDLGTESYPVILPVTPDTTSILPWYPKPAQVKGELYAVRPFVFKALDTHRTNGVQFERMRVRLHYPFYEVRKRKGLEQLSRAEKDLRNPEEAKKFLSEELTATPSCWMYVGRTAYWLSEIGETAYDLKLTKLKQFETTKNDFRYAKFTRAETLR